VDEIKKLAKAKFTPEQEKTFSESKKFEGWFKKNGYKFTPTTDDEKDWFNVVRFWAWKAWEARGKRPPE